MTCAVRMSARSEINLAHATGTLGRERNYRQMGATRGQRGAEAHMFFAVRTRDFPCSWWNVLTNSVHTSTCFDDAEHGVILPVNVWYTLPGTHPEEHVGPLHIFEYYRTVSAVPDLYVFKK